MRYEFCIITDWMISHMGNYIIIRRQVFQHKFYQYVCILQKESSMLEI